MGEPGGGVLRSNGGQGLGDGLFQGGKRGPWPNGGFARCGNHGILHHAVDWALTGSI